MAQGCRTDPAKRRPVTRSILQPGQALPRRHAGGERVKSLLVGLLLLPCVPCQALAAGPGCPPSGQTEQSLRELKAEAFAVPDDARRKALAEGLLACLGDPDPALRDGIAYEALAQWMRAGALDAAVLRKLRDALYGMLEGGDAEGFRRPFAALVLSEVARSDRIRPWMTPDERDAMVSRAAAYLLSVRDYRGFDDRQGWRHGVAHGADWLMQLSLNPALGRPQLDAILAAVASQAVPENAHAYISGEPERLARPVIFIARRGVHSAADWQAWFAALVPRIGDPGKAYGDSAWLARRHDLTAFLLHLYLEADQSDDARIARLKPAIAAALKQVP